MYVQKLFEETRLDKLQQLIEDYPLGAVIVSSAQDLAADLLPIELVRNGAHGCLRGHVSRANPLWQRLAEGAQAMLVFQGPNAYISPRWYVNGTRSGRNAPSWNYITVHAWGPVRVVQDPAWLRAHLSALANHQEAGRPDPWAVADASPAFVDDMLPHIVGFEMEIQRLQGKWFLSQQRTPADRQSIAQALQRESPPRHGASQMAALLLPPAVADE